MCSRNTLKYLYCTIVPLQLILVMRKTVLYCRIYFTHVHKLALLYIFNIHLGKKKNLLYNKKKEKCREKRKCFLLCFFPDTAVVLLLSECDVWSSRRLDCEPLRKKQLCNAWNWAVERKTSAITYEACNFSGDYEFCLFDIKSPPALTGGACFSLRHHCSASVTHSNPNPCGEILQFSPEL